jgi:hypothetical protein
VIIEGCVRQRQPVRGNRVAVAGWQCLVSLECPFKELSNGGRITEYKWVLREIWVVV